MNTISKLRNEKRGYIKEADALSKILLQRDHTPEEQQKWDDLVAKIQSLSDRIDKLEQIRDEKKEDDDDDPAFGEGNPNIDSGPSRSIRRRRSRSEPFVQ